jgi:putative membrane protein
MKGLLAAVSVSALLAAAPAWAQNTATESRTLNQQDRTFIQEAGAGSLAEVELGQLAEQKAATPAIREFGRWMATDHSLANNWLTSVLQEQHENIQPTLTAEQRQEKQKLEGLSGAQFDRQYIDLMVQDHEKTVPLFEKEGREGHNLALKTFAESLTPVLQQHLAEAKELAGTGGVAEREGTAGTTERTGTSTPQR